MASIDDARVINDAHLKMDRIDCSGDASCVQAAQKRYLAAQSDIDKRNADAGAQRDICEKRRRASINTVARVRRLRVTMPHAFPRAPCNLERIEFWVDAKRVRASRFASPSPPIHTDAQQPDRRAPQPRSSAPAKKRILI